MADPQRRFGVTRAGLRQLGRRTREWRDRMIQEWQNYFLTPMVGKDGSAAQYQSYAYAIHLILGSFSEALIRVVLSFVFVMALAGANAGVINFTLAALAKALALGACIMLMGRVSAYSRFENLLASWWPSSRRMFSGEAIQPYADLVHVIVYAIFQYAGSLLGLALALWVSNSFTINLGQPSTTADTFGLFGTYAVTTSDLWLIEMYGSALVTFTWLMVVVHREGVKHHVYAGLAMGLAFFAIAAVTIAASGANFDFIHYAALRTVLAGKGTVNTSHTAAYLVAPLIGCIIAWVGYLIVASLAFAGGYSKPGIAGPGYEVLGAERRFAAAAAAKVAASKARARAQVKGQHGM